LVEHAGVTAIERDTGRDQLVDRVTVELDLDLVGFHLAREPIPNAHARCIA